MITHRNDLVILLIRLVVLHLLLLRQLLQQRLHYLLLQLGDQISLYLQSLAMGVYPWIRVVVAVFVILALNFIVINAGTIIIHGSPNQVIATDAGNFIRRLESVRVVLLLYGLLLLLILRVVLISFLLI